MSSKSNNKIIENTPYIETKRLILRKFTEDDLEYLFLILSDEKANKFLPWFVCKNIEQAKEHLNERYLLYYKKKVAYRYAVCLKSDNKPIGYVSLGDEPSNDFGYGLRACFWNKGIITEASLSVIERIKNAGFLYITATHDVNNIASGEVMKKLGMTYKYSYNELCQPKNIEVAFKMYQLNFDGNNERTYKEYLKY